ncbi:ABC transporter permease [Virgibacillus halodenitrificans]|uniref:ABC transporter permease n=1 Tax=Virgibacillus halodenitrificans TaxID=1482 RepID=UPI0002FCD3FD|nr:ABC transporter permease [Virgibacillus halodenitrificans]MYL44491.1 ABC transporter permease subunit [Virgibacillus halodenitrificans]WHX25635.1 ABC transporter permease [Virgibacillus halodenitrificans]
MILFLIKRLLQTIPVIIGVTIVVFLIMQMVPGDPAQILAGEGASKQAIEDLRHEYGLDRPLHIQYFDYMQGVLQGDLGLSLKSSQPVYDEIMSRLPITVELAFYSTLITVVLGVIAGIVSAVRPNSVSDMSVMVVALLGISFPSFFLGLLLMYVFSVELQWLPVAGWDSVKHMILPAFALGASGAAIVARMTRSSMLEVVRQDYIRTAKAKGLNAYLIIYKHALRNALIPVITVVGLQFGALLGGTVLIESVFAINGLGRLIVESIRMRDLPMVQGGVLVASLVFVIVNLLVDVLYKFFNRRIDLN